MVDGQFLSNVLSNMNPAEIMVVGQNPGREEVERDEPFVGEAGRRFDEAIKKILGIDRKDLYISNTIRCLRYNCKVLLTDGSWKNISHLVRERYEGEVVSLSRLGQLENKRVIGWHKSLVAGRKMLKLSYRGAKGSSKGTVGPVVTFDHPVHTKDGYKKACDLLEDDIIAIGEPSPNEVLNDVIVGSMLGDAGLSFKTASFQETHSIKQKDYVLFKQRCLRHFGCKYREFESDGFRKAGISTLAFRFFADCRKRFYPNRKKVAWAVGSLSDLAIAVWYMDDGNLVQHGNRSPAMCFSTNSFSDKEVDYLCGLLNTKGVIDARRVWSNGWRIRVGFRGTDALAERIAPFILPSLRYKLPAKFKDIPFVDISSDCDVGCHWEPCPLIREVSYPDKNFYCIDVEENHNFVTTGGIVVHNCYTPGNRKPFENEVDNCRCFLDKEIELLKPKVIVALGGIALKQLTGLNGVMKHHGKIVHSVRYSTPVMSVLHPSPLNTNNPERKAAFYDDLKNLKEFLDGRHG